MNIFKRREWWIQTSAGQTRHHFICADPAAAPARAAALAARLNLPEGSWTLKHDPKATWSGAFTRRGKQILRHLGTHIKAEAEKRMRALLAAAEAERWADLEAHKTRRQLATLQDLFTCYRQRARAKNRENNIGALCSIIRRALPQHGAKTKDEIGRISSQILTARLMSDFQTAILTAAGEDRIKRATGAVTANSLRRQACSLFTSEMLEFYRTDYQLPDLAGFLRVKPLPARKRTFQMPEPGLLAQIRADATRLRAQDPNLYRAFLLSLGAGLRRREIAFARWDWLIHRPITTPAGATETRPFLHIQVTQEFDTKDAEDRLVPLDPDIVTELVQLRTPRIGLGPDYILEGHKTERLDYTFDRFSVWLAGFGWTRKKKSHEFRKIFNTLKRQAEGAAAARAALGHASDRVNLEHYTDTTYTDTPLKIFGT